MPPARADASQLVTKIGHDQRAARGSGQQLVAAARAARTATLDRRLPAQTQPPRLFDRCADETPRAAEKRHGFVASDSSS